MPSSYDAVIIGGGHNGLVAGCYLARAGLRPVVLEARSAVGGMSSSGASIPEAPDHLINYCALDMIFLQASGIAVDLELAKFGYRELEVDPPNIFLHEDGEASLAFWRDPARTADEMRRFSRSDADSFLELMRTLVAAIDVGVPLISANPMRPDVRSVAKAGRAALSARRSLLKVGSVMTVSAAQVIDEHFEHPVVRDAIATQIGIATPTDIDGGGLGLLLFPFFQRFGDRRPVGGTQALPNALAAAFRSLGGTIRTDAVVEEILMSGGEATGVRLEGGEQIMGTKGVIATCDPRSALDSLLPDDVLDPKMKARVKHIPGSTDGYLKVDMAMSGQLRVLDKLRRDGVDPRVPSIYLGGFDQSINAYKESRAGRIPADYNLQMSIPTAAEPSQAPEGQDTVFLWAHPMPLKPEGSWKSVADEAAKSVVSRASAVYEGIEELEIGRYIKTPEVMEEQMRVYEGCIYHVDFSLFRMGPLRPAPGLAGYRSPVDRLYLGGAGSPPMGAVSGIPGRNSARELMRDQGRRGKKASRSKK